jgi:hypothetical protein
VPVDALAATGATVEDLGKDKASPPLRACLRALSIRTGQLLDQSALFSSRINDYRLALEVAVIQALARRLVGMLSERDPLSERVHLKAPGVAGVGLIGLFNGTIGRIGRMLSASHKPRRA